MPSPPSRNVDPPVLRDRWGTVTDSDGGTCHVDVRRHGPPGLMVRVNGHRLRMTEELEVVKALSIEDMLPPLPITADLRDVDAYTPTVANRIILALAAAGVERGTGRQQPGA